MEITIRTLYKTVLFLLPVLLLVQFFYVKDVYFIKGLALAFFLFLAWRRENKLYFSCIDVCVLLIGVCDLFYSFFSVEMTVSFLHLITTVYSTFYYFLLRTIFRRSSQLNGLLLIYSLLIGFISLIAFTYFFWFVDTVHHLGFTGLYDFRFLLKPLGIINNEWASLQLLFLGIIVTAIYGYRSNRKIIYLLVAIGLLVLFQLITSFSRGVYLSFFLFVIGAGFIFKGKLLERRWLYIALTCAVCISVLVLWHKEDVLKTLKITTSISQQRSLKNRFTTMDATKCFIREHPLGGGTGNYLLLMEKYLYGDENIGVTTYASNFFCRLLVEKGIPGLFLYLIIGGIILYYCFKRKNTITSISTLTLFVFLFREQTFSSFWSSQIIQLLVYTFLFIMQQGDMKFRKPFRKNRYVPIFPLSVWAILFIFVLLYRQERKHNIAFITAIEAGNTLEASKKIERRGGATPCLINKALFSMYLEVETKKEKRLHEAESYIREAISSNPYDIQLSYYLAINLFEQGKMNDGLLILRKLINRYPNNTLWQWEMFQRLYQIEQKERAAIHLAKCIELSPRIMNTDAWMKYMRTDSCFVGEVKDILSKRMRYLNVKSDPIVIAKYGKIAFNLGEISVAKKYICLSLEQLPNLSMAWYNLSEIVANEGKEKESLLFKKRAIVMGMGMFVSTDSIKDSNNLNLMIEMENDLENILYGKYRFKFREWYGTDLVNIPISSWDKSIF